MTNEMKLLTALCDALGFDVERVCVNQDSIDKGAENAIQAIPWSATLVYSEPYATYHLAPIYEYKLTKRADG